MQSSVTGWDIIHLHRGCCDETLLKRFHSELVATSFEPDEVEPFEEWLIMMSNDGEGGHRGVGTTLIPPHIRHHAAELDGDDQGVSADRSPDQHQLHSATQTHDGIAVHHGNSDDVHTTTLTSTQPHDDPHIVTWRVDHSRPFWIDFHVFLAVVKKPPDGSCRESASGGCQDDHHGDATSSSSTAGAETDTSEIELLGGVSCERYNLSNTTLLAYLVTAPAARRRGVARALLDSVRGVADGGLLVVETKDCKGSTSTHSDVSGGHNATTPSTSSGPTRLLDIDARDRLALYERWGFVVPKDFPYVIPAHDEGAPTIRGYLLQVRVLSAMLS